VPSRVRPTLGPVDSSTPRTKLSKSEFRTSQVGSNQTDSSWAHVRPHKVGFTLD